jgi:urease accessory protein
MTSPPPRGIHPGRLAHPRPVARGEVELAVVAGRTAAVRLRSASPLRLLWPRQRSAAGWVVAGTYGGGLVSGDHVDLTVVAGPGTAAVLGTQASTKVYRSAAGADVEPDCGRDAGGGGGGGVTGTCVQSLAATLGDEATFISWPDPVTCFAGARYRQTQAFDLAGSASLVAVDWLTSGRMARGERWAFARYESLTRVAVAGRPGVHDALRLDPADGPLDAPGRTGGMACLGTAWLVGPAFAAAAAAVLAAVGRAPIDPRRDVQFAASPLADGGAVVRFAGRSTEAASRWLRATLAGTLAVVGLDPWARRG